MALDNTTNLSIAELAIYTVLVPITVYLFFQHGRRSTLGYIYLFAFESLRIVSACLQISAHSHHKTSSTTGSIIASVGLSPLILAISGFIYELSSYSYTHRQQQQQQQQQQSSDRTRRLLIVREVLVHLGAYTGIALAASGASNLANSNATASDIDHAHTLQETGVTLILITWLGETYMCSRLCMTLGIFSPASVSLSASCLLVGARCIYSVVYAFDHSPSVNPITGSFAIKVILVFLVQLVAVVALLIVGFVTRDIARDHGVMRSWRRGGRRGRGGHGGHGGQGRGRGGGGDSEGYMLRRPVEIDRGTAETIIPLRSPK
ncbi:hypothetical protein RBB50_012247 [Rhinocladiella similis]